MAKKPIQLDAQGYRKFGARDKWAYAAGDFGCNMSFALKGTMTLFWTQFMGITEARIALLVVLLQVWDAINDPLIGSLVDADHRQYKRDKFLQYILLGSVGLIVGGAMCFLPFPNAPYLVKNILYVAGYIIWDAFYTVANVPYGSLLSLITRDPVERTELSTFRSIGSIVGNIVPMVLLPVLIYDASNNLVGERVFFIALLMGCLGFISFQFMIRNTEIRAPKSVKLNEEQPKFNVFKAMGNFLKNRAAVGATLVPVGQFVGMYGAQTATQVLFQSYFQNAKISGLVSMFSMVGMFLFMPFVKKFVANRGKKEACTIGALISVAAYTLLLILPMPANGIGILIFMGCQLIASVGLGCMTLVGWALMADAMDYEEWKFGTRNEGTTYALHSFFRKLAQGVGPSMGILVASWLGYDASLKAAQTAEVALRMRYLVAAFYLLSGLLMFIGIAVVYNLDKKTMEKMNAELAVRRGENINT